MHDWFRFVLAVFACFRLAELITVDRGPGDVFKKARIAAGSCNLAEDSEPDTDLGRLFDCPYCFGIWFSLIAALFIPTQRRRDKLGWWFAIAGGQAVLQKIAGRT